MDVGVSRFGDLVGVKCDTGVAILELSVTEQLNPKTYNPRKRESYSGDSGQAIVTNVGLVK